MILTDLVIIVGVRRKNNLIKLSNLLEFRTLRRPRIILVEKNSTSVKFRIILDCYNLITSFDENLVIYENSVECRFFRIQYKDEVILF